MSRATDEWIGRDDDHSIPARVRLRVFDRFNGQCAVCTRRIGGSLRPAYDHIIALINGGENRERNLQLLCVPCHQAKTGMDVKLKSRVASVRKKHLGIRKRSTFACSRDSKWKKRIDGTVVAR